MIRRWQSESLRTVRMMIVGTCLLSVEGALAAPPTIVDVQAMRANVEQQGLAAFMAETTSNSWQAPVMPSAWYLDHGSPADQRPYYEAARDLGSALLTAIDAWAPLMRTDGPDDVLTKATVLVDVAYWVNTAEGYANVDLGGRARDVAITGLARRVADLNVPLGPTKAQVARCNAPFDAPIIFARILNFEAGAALFPTTPDVTDVVLGQIWGGRRAQMRLREILAIPTPASTPGTAWISSQEERRLLEFLVTPGQPDPTDTFFLDDEEPTPGPNTTRKFWNKKYHQGVLGSQLPQNVFGAETLIQFREVIGAFPLQPVQRKETIASSGEEAFADAWRPHLGTATLNLGRAAWSVYEGIQDGSFVDFDTMVTRANPP